MYIFKVYLRKRKVKVIQMFAGYTQGMYRYPSHSLIRLVKSTVHDLNPIQHISPHGPQAVDSLFVLKKTSGVCTQSCICKWETNSVARSKPSTIPANQHFFGSTEGRVSFYWLLSSNIINFSRDSQTTLWCVSPQTHRPPFDVSHPRLTDHPLMCLTPDSQTTLWCVSPQL